MEQSYKILQQSPQFKDWRIQNPHHELVHAFLMLNKNASPHWQFGYYSADHDTIATFTVEDQTVQHQPDTQAFKDPDKKILPLDIDSVQVSFDDALEISQNINTSKHNGLPVNTTIGILQNITTFGTVWNMTLVNVSFNALNVKIDAKSGQIVHEHMESLMNLGQRV
ncbi:MAG TPA: hypothetical protein VK158_02930 [Acidobacteriota bacterium]|nr:hypothetical protein [Acidobacteriota bacterium]